MKLRSHVSFVVAVATLAALNSTSACATQPVVASGAMAPPPAIYQRVASADVVVVGKIVRFADKTIVAKQYPNSPKPTEFSIAIVKIEDAILNPNGLTEVRVGILPPPPPPKPGGPFGSRPPGWGQFRPKVGETHVLYLQEHDSKPFYQARSYYDHALVTKMTPALKKQFDGAKSYAKLLDKPMLGLQSKSADVRFTTAAMLVARYRAWRPGERKEVAVDAKESKLILQALHDADWNVKRAYNQLSPHGVFSMLGLQPTDGWKFPRRAQDFAPQAKKWLNGNLATYRVKRFVKADAKK